MIRKLINVANINWPKITFLTVPQFVYLSALDNILGITIYTLQLREQFMGTLILEKKQQLRTIRSCQAHVRKDITENCPCCTQS